MSHFTVIVVGENIDAQLEPYCEQDANPKYMEFVDVEEQYRKEYAEKTTKIVTLKDGRKFSQYHESFRSKDGFRSRGDEYTYPEGAVIAEGPFSDLYPTFEEYIEDWAGYEKNEETGKYGYWTNPNAKWDWYTVGGRWSGFFKTKKGGEGKLGRPGAFNNVPRAGYVDSIKVGDIDIGGMRRAAAEEANKTYDELEAILKGRPLPSWKKTLEKHNDNVQAARDEYNNLPVVKDMNAAKFFVWGDLQETFCNSREEYVQRCQNNVMVPYAIVKDGRWYEKGSMGWFGISTGDMSEDQWAAQFWEMLRTLTPDTTLTLVDCHI